LQLHLPQLVLQHQDSSLEIFLLPLLPPPELWMRPMRPAVPLSLLLLLFWSKAVPFNCSSRIDGVATITATATASATATTAVIVVYNLRMILPTTTATATATIPTATSAAF
jgi:hypothetical protein